MFWLIPLIGAIAVFLFNVWNKLPKDVKLAVIEAIISSFIELFKKYYQHYKKHNK